MKEKYIELAVAEFAESGNNFFEKKFKVEGYDEIFVVSIRKRKKQKNKHFTCDNVSNAALEKYNSISALPSGNSCECCGGSGKI